MWVCVYIEQTCKSLYKTFSKNKKFYKDACGDTDLEWSSIHITGDGDEDALKSDGDREDKVCDNGTALLFSVSGESTLNTYCPEFTLLSVEHCSIEVAVFIEGKLICLLPFEPKFLKKEFHYWFANTCFQFYMKIDKCYKLLKTDVSCRWRRTFYMHVGRRSEREKRNIKRSLISYKILKGMKQEGVSIWLISRSK